MIRISSFHFHSEDMNCDECLPWFTSGSSQRNVHGERGQAGNDYASVRERNRMKRRMKQRHALHWFGKTRRHTESMQANTIKRQLPPQSGLERIFSQINNSLNAAAEIDTKRCANAFRWLVHLHAPEWDEAFRRHVISAIFTLFHFSTRATH